MMVFGAGGLALAGLVVKPTPVAGFTQSGVGGAISNGIPMGHEWITRMAAMELLGDDPLAADLRDPADPRTGWQRGKPKARDITAATAEIAQVKSRKVGEGRYRSTYRAVYSAIMGERWVDIGGFTVSNGQAGTVISDAVKSFGSFLGRIGVSAKPANSVSDWLSVNSACFDSVTQLSDEVQYDHFLRRSKDSGASGGAAAAAASRDRFIAYFVAAATAPRGNLVTWDGGGTSDRIEVDRNYFLLGRAIHLLQDSFSPDHTVRMETDNFEKLRQVKSYLCTAGSEQHAHSVKDVITTYEPGDVIWKPDAPRDPRWRSYKPSYMKPVALVATNATIDAWAAFFRTMSKNDKDRAQAAKDEATRLADDWLAYDQEEMASWYNNPNSRGASYVLGDGQQGKGDTVQGCMSKLDAGTSDQSAYMQKVEQNRRSCLYNIVSKDDSGARDAALRIPYNWGWRNKLVLEEPPASWQAPSN